MDAWAARQLLVDFEGYDWDISEKKYTQMKASFPLVC